MEWICFGSACVIIKNILMPELHKYSIHELITATYVRTAISYSTLVIIYLQKSDISYAFEL